MDRGKSERSKPEFGSLSWSARVTSGNRHCGTRGGVLVCVHAISPTNDELIESGQGLLYQGYQQYSAEDAF